MINEKEFDYKKYLEKKGVHKTIDKIYQEYKKNVFLVDEITSEEENEDYNETSYHTRIEGHPTFIGQVPDISFFRERSEIINKVEINNITGFPVRIENKICRGDWRKERYKDEEIGDLHYNQFGIPKYEFDSVEYLLACGVLKFLGDLNVMNQEHIFSYLEKRQNFEEFVKSKVGEAINTHFYSF